MDCHSFTTGDLNAMDPDSADALQEAFLEFARMKVLWFLSSGVKIEPSALAGT